jgi:dipeptidase D
MTGAAGLAPDALTARRYINLDWETEGSIALGAAGGIKLDIRLPMPSAALQNVWEVYHLEISGLLGGHSGLAIGKNRANANVLAARVLKDTVPVRVIAFDGGTADNAIAPSVVVALAVAGENADALKNRVSALGLTLRREYLEEKGLRLSLTRQQATPSVAASLADSRTLFSLLLDIPQDVHELSTRFPGLPETSNNIGMVNLVNGAARLKVFHRSFNPKKLEAFAQMVEETASKAGAASIRRSAFPTWPPDPESALYKQSLVSYEKALGIPLETHVIHAGLECGFIAEKFPGIEIISLGPTLIDVHTPTERLHLPSVEKVSSFMRRLLKNL